MAGAMTRPAQGKRMLAPPYGAMVNREGASRQNVRRARYVPTRCDSAYASDHSSVSKRQGCGGAGTGASYRSFLSGHVRRTETGCTCKDAMPTSPQELISPRCCVPPQHPTLCRMICIPVALLTPTLIITRDDDGRTSLFFQGMNISPKPVPSEPEECDLSLRITRILIAGIVRIARGPTDLFFPSFAIGAKSEERAASQVLYAIPLSTTEPEISRARGGGRGLVCSEALCSCKCTHDYTSVDSSHFIRKLRQRTITECSEEISALELFDECELVVCALGRPCVSIDLARPHFASAKPI